MNPNFLKKVLESKKMSLDELFNLEVYPNYPTNELNEVKEQQEKVDIHLKYAEQCFRNGDDDLLSELRQAKYYNQKLEQNIYQIEKTLDEYKYSYESLLEFVEDLINNEKIDLRKYTGNISDDEWKILTRDQRVKRILRGL